MGKAEAHIEKYLQKQAKEKGFICLKLTTPGFNGVPDRLLIGYGQVLFIELKKQGCIPRQLQEEIINKLKAHGAIIYVCDSKEQIDKIFDKFPVTLCEHIRQLKEHLKAYLIKFRK